MGEPNPYSAKINGIPAKVQASASPFVSPTINSICDLSAFHQKTNVFAFGKSGISETFKVGDGVLQSGLFQKEFNISFLTVGDNADSIIL